MCRRLVKMMHKAGGTGTFFKDSTKTIRLVNRGCTNRPFYHIVVAEKFREVKDQVIEQIGSMDPMPNEHNEKLVALNLERIRYWLGEGVKVSIPASEIFGLAGLFPMAPQTYMKAWRNRKQLAQQAATGGEAQETSS
ncbi:probable 28S ribosomal protein S16, mitochondrial [Sitodiplosis mosellana]|uniref:probable 28S ribosomal protein S16, mitochondrial n=1 Tax=Sitodiplosis mosellana TaxID=263140 RepID=UPI0024443AAD|nr:probable 28S ribosomal protein S16, mitochondrial [Sitodiplosis mosellana]XP_055316955.1 probable 28S ribosomal protein S16, mitochondrial [Sitodiplosis mosellana]XP_055316956.1 probable 28S ribosomal protein S16, mitochondrial [Sitodiplosis mosellana]